MLDFFINEPLGSENVDEQLFNHHAENITVLKPEHEFHQDLKVFEVFDTIKNLVTVQHYGAVNQLYQFGFINGKGLAFGKLCDHLGKHL